MKMKKPCARVVALLVSLILLFAISAGCEKQLQEKESTKETTSEATELETAETKKLEATLKFVLPGDPPKAQGEVAEAIEKELAKDGMNFKLDFSFVPWGEYWNKLALIAASAEKYDLTWTHITTIANLVSKKAMAPLDGALKAYGPEIMKSTPDYFFDAVSFDGKIYAMPRVMLTAELDHSFLVRGDLRKKYNISEIKTVDGLEKYFEAIAENEPDMVAIHNEGGEPLLREYGNVILPSGGGMKYPVYIDPEDKDLKVKNFIESDIFKNLMGKMREWNEKGYMPYSPHDIKNSPLPNAPNALNSGKIAAFRGGIIKLTELIDKFKANMPDGELENVFLNPEKPKYIFASADNLLSVFSTSEYVNESIAFVNWFRSNQENYDLFCYGIKDVNYKLDGNSVSHEGIAPEHSYMPISWAWNDVRFHRFSKHLSSEYVESLKNWDINAKKSPLLGFLVNEASIKAEMAQIKAIMVEYVTMLYLSEIDWDSTMEKFKKSLKDAGIDEVIAEVQRQVDDFAAKNK